MSKLFSGDRNTEIGLLVYFPSRSHRGVLVHCIASGNVLPHDIPVLSDRVSLAIREAIQIFQVGAFSLRHHRSVNGCHAFITL